MNDMEVSDALRLLNSWWTSGKVKSELVKPYRRPVFSEVYDLLENYKEVIILTGLRRVGKTTIMYQIIDELLKKVKPTSIIYFTFDYGNADITAVLDAYQQLTNIDWKEEKIYLFLDEVQKLKSWSQQVKILYDAFPNIRFVLSGSASLQLEKDAIDNLAGRYYLVEVPVLSISEYYSLKYDKIIENVKLYEEEIGRELETYIRRPFPELAKVTDEARAYEYIRESVIAKIVSQDMLQEFEKVDIPLLNSLVSIFFAEPGMILNIDSLSRTLKKRKQEIERHIHMLEFAKIIRIVKNYRPSVLSESRKLRKVYPYDISLALAENPSLEKGKITEALIVSRLDIKLYWREGNKEIDCLIGDRKDLIPIEVKASDVLKEEYIKNLNYFVQKFNTKLGALLYYGKRVDLGKIKVINIKDVLIYGFYDAIGVHQNNK
ncbi:MAG: hypothetical protein ARM1_0555 [Candidatus Micrarchaeota archaeon]|nr:MAG: hypothetical protein ARM1_0555 [Candidatus Micrarchaeota archaeon]